MDVKKSHELFERAQRLLPGGVNSPVRAMRSVGMEPLFISRGQGSRMYDVDGNSYIDYVCSWGPLILGHAHPAILEKLEKTLRDGTSFGAPSPLEVEMAQMVVDAFPSVEMVRMVSSGTEATMSALRVARGFTGRDKLIKFTGCYHGAVDSLLVQAGSAVATLSLPDSPGVTKGTSADTILAPYNSLEAVGEIMQRQGEQIAAVIVEPVAGNMGVVPPAAGFLEGLRSLTEKFGALLIFDEVITGFRLSYGGAQKFFGIMPDITCLGKIIGGGLPVGAFGARREIMESVAPAGSTYQAGTLSGNPLAMAAGIATLTELGKPGVYEELERKSAKLSTALKAAAAKSNKPVSSNRIGAMSTLFFTDEPVTDFASAKKSDTEMYAAYFKHMLENGVYLAPSQFEAVFMSLAHSDDDIDATARAAGGFFQS